MSNHGHDAEDLATFGYEQQLRRRLGGYASFRRRVRRPHLPVGAPPLDADVGVDGFDPTPVRMVVTG